MEIALLGPLTVTRDGIPLPLGGTQPRLLLALLALEPGRVVSADRLVDAIWGAHLPGEPANALQVVASRLRRALAPDQLVISSSPGYLLAVDPDQVDAARFERRTAEAQAASGDPERAARLLREALGLWRGDALADFPGVAAAQAAAARLEELRLAALEARVEADLTLGRAAQVVGELQTLVEQAPLRERLHALRMRALYATGRQVDALAAYQHARTVLADRAGLDPGPELRRLQQQLLSQDPALSTGPGPGPAPTAHADGSARPRQHNPAPAAAPPHPPPSPPPRTNLRTPPTSFVGRDDEMARVRALLDRARLVTLVGPGGAGKTRLATETATRLLQDGDAGRDGTWLAELAPLRDPALLPTAVLNAVSPAEGPTRPAAAPAVADTGDGDTARLLRTLADRQLLLVLDNCEHLVDAAAGLAEAVLAACPGVRILATSREALRIPGELRLPVPALPTPSHGVDDPAELHGYGAVQLFADRARAVDPGFGLDAPGTIRAVAEVCRRLDGLPLAIELAAARIDVLPAPALAARLDDRFRLLTAGARTALPRHRTLRAVVEWSWELLPPVEQAALRRLAVFTGGCTLRAAEQVLAAPDLPAGDVAAAVAGLAGKSLLEVGPGPVLPPPWWPGIEHAELPAVPEPPPGEPRYRLLETVRVYALEQLAAAGETEPVAGAHAAWCVAEAEEAQTRLYSADQLTWRTRVHAERGNLHAALRRLLDQRDADGAIRVASVLAWQWGLPGHHDHAVAELRAALDLPGATRDLARAQALTTYALLSRLSRAPDRLRPEDVPAGIATAVTAFREAGAPAHAALVATLERSLGLRRPPPDPAAAGPHDGSGSSGNTGRLVDEALAEGGWSQPIAWSSMLHALSGVLGRVTVGDLAGARHDVEEWVARLRRIGDRMSLIDSLGVLAFIAMTGGDDRAAEAHLRDALRYACELRYPAEMAVQLSTLGALELERGHFARAHDHLRQALAAFEQLGAADMAAWTHYSLSMAALTAGDDPTARAEHDLALERFRQLDIAVGLVAAQALLGMLTARAGDPDRAAELHRHALTAARQTGDPATVSLVLQTMAVTAAATGHAEQTALLLGAAEQREPGPLAPGPPPGMAESLPTRLLDGAVTAARRALGEEVFETAKKRGRKLGPDGVAETENSP